MCHKLSKIDNIVHYYKCTQYTLKYLIHSNPNILRNTEIENQLFLGFMLEVEAWDGYQIRGNSY